MRSFAFGTWPSHALHQVNKQGCPSSLALITRDGSRREIADIPVSRPRRGTLGGTIIAERDGAFDPAAN